MTARQKTDLFANLPHRPIAVSDGTRLKGHAAAIKSAPATNRSAISRAVTAFTSTYLPCDHNRGFNSQPAAAVKSP